VLPRFRAQGHGVLINNASVYSHVGAPWLTAYVSGKFAVRGSSESLRQELGDLPDVHVCTVSPSPIDTPIFASTAKYFVLKNLGGRGDPHGLRGCRAGWAA
jgi:short-subunit dehydrogenase